MRCTLPLAVLAVFAIAATTAPVALAGSDGPTASAAARCSLSGKERKLGPTYVTALSVTGVSCATGQRVVKDYYRCRVRNGGRKGRCHSRVRGFRCTERRESISTQFDARVSCRKGSQRVKHDYTQFT
jgi:hypothetical protein